MSQQCPCCQRPFEKMFDYPRILVRAVEILSIPEVMDFFSEEAASARLDRMRFQNDVPADVPTPQGINRTPEIANAYEFLQGYFRALEACQGQEVSPLQLVPPLQPHGYFRWAYTIPNSRLYVAFSEAAPEDQKRVCQVMFYGDGPNLGSAGGPTLQPFGVVAAVQYEGRLTGPMTRGDP